MANLNLIQFSVAHVFRVCNVQGIMGGIFWHFTTHKGPFFLVFVERRNSGSPKRKGNLASDTEPNSISSSFWSLCLCYNAYTKKGLSSTLQTHISKHLACSSPLIGICWRAIGQRDVKVWWESVMIMKTAHAGKAGGGMGSMLGYGK